MSKQFELTVKRNIHAPVKAVFEAWLTADALKKFMCPAEGMSVPKAEVDAREGGSFLIVMQAGDKEMPHRGEYKRIDKYKELSFTWISSFTIPDSLVTLTFNELSERETELTLHHVGFPNEESRENHNGGWSSIVEKLAKLVA
jgi:uncharacterized protein YndB with AHSA1/START domain